MVKEEPNGLLHTREEPTGVCVHTYQSWFL